MTKTKSPIKDKPLRYVAQSADEAIDDLLNDKVLMYYMAAIVCLMAVAWEWIRFYNPLEQRPILLSILCGLFFVFCGYKIYKHIIRLKNLKLGRSGERVVGQYLESLRESGGIVYHDILGDSFNVDHVVISPKGIYVIETKTYSKPARGKATINYDGQRILVNGSLLRC